MYQNFYLQEDCKIIVIIDLPYFYCYKSLRFLLLLQIAIHNSRMSDLDISAKNTSVFLLSGSC